MCKQDVHIARTTFPRKCTEASNYSRVSSAVPKKGMAHPLGHRLLSSEQITQFGLSAFFCQPLLGNFGTDNQFRQSYKCESLSRAPAETLTALVL